MISLTLRDIYQYNIALNALPLVNIFRTLHEDCHIVSHGGFSKTSLLHKYFGFNKRLECHMIYDIFVYSYSHVHVNGFWEIIVTFSIFFKFCCTIFTSGIMFRILIMHVKFGAKTAKTYFAEKNNKTNECHEFVLSSDGGKCSAISWSQGSSVLQTKWS